MLVLSRKREEAVDINLNSMPIEQIIALHARGELIITATVVDLRGDKARLGFSAAKEIPIHRREVANAIARERSAAA